MQKLSHSSKKTSFLSIAFLIVAGLTIYANSLNGAFVWDDNLLVRDNVYIRDWQYLPQLFTQDFGMGAGVKYGYYRPLQIFTHMFDYSLWGDNIKGYHFTNVVLHILTAISLYCFVLMLWKDALLARLTSLLFLVHPIHTEAVANITSRMDPLALLFMLVCFIAYIKYLQKRKTGAFLLMILSYSLALLSKENSLILPALLLLYHYAFKEKFKLWPFFTIVVCSALYLISRAAILESSLAQASIFEGAISRIPGFFVAITSYIRLLLAPFDLHAEYGDNLFRLNDLRAILGMLLIGSSVLYAFLIRKRNGLISFALFWFFISLLPASGIYPTAFYMAEHYLYMPSVGFFIILAWLLCAAYRAKSFRAPAVLIISGILIFCSYLTIQQNSYWSEPIDFYNRTLQYNPNNARIHDKLGVALYDVGRIEEAVSTYKKALEVDPENDSAHNNLGNAYYEIGQFEAAILAYENALEINPQLARAYYNMANAYISIGRKEIAIDLFKRAIKENPDYADAYNNLGALYGSLGNTEEAIISVKAAIRIDPKHAEAYNNLALIYFSKEEHSSAIEYYDIADKLGNINPELNDALEPYRR